MTASQGHKLIQWQWINKISCHTISTLLIFQLYSYLFFFNIPQPIHWFDVWTVSLAVCVCDLSCINNKGKPLRHPPSACGHACPPLVTGQLIPMYLYFSNVLILSRSKGLGRRIRSIKRMVYITQQWWLKQFKIQRKQNIYIYCMTSQTVTETHTTRVILKSVTFW